MPTQTVWLPDRGFVQRREAWRHNRGAGPGRYRKYLEEELAQRLIEAKGNQSIVARDLEMSRAGISIFLKSVPKKSDPGFLRSLIQADGKSRKKSEARFQAIFGDFSEVKRSIVNVTHPKRHSA